MRSNLAVSAKLSVRYHPAFFLTLYGKRLLNTLESLCLETPSSPVLLGRKLP